MPSRCRRIGTRPIGSLNAGATALLLSRGSCADTSLGKIGPVHAGRYLARVLAQDAGDVDSLRTAVARVGTRL